MASGINLGVLLICLVQAEHDSCLWDTKAPGLRHDGNEYVGFSQSETKPSRCGGGHPQNVVGQASTTSPDSDQSQGIPGETGVGSGYRQGRSETGLSKTRYVQSDYASATWAPRRGHGMAAVSKSYRTNGHKMPYQAVLGLPTGSYVSKSRPDSKHYYQNDHSSAARKPVLDTVKETGPVRLSTGGWYPSSGARSAQSLRDSFTSTSHRPAAQKKLQRPRAPPAYVHLSSILFPAKAPKVGFSPSVGDVQSPQRSTGGDPVSQQGSFPRGRSSTSIPARRVPLHHAASDRFQKPSHHASAQGEGTTTYTPIYSEGKRYRSQLFPVSGGGNVEGRRTRPISSPVSYSRSAPVLPYRTNAPARLQQPSGVKMPTSEKFSYRSSYTSIDTMLIPQNTASSPTLGARTPPASGQGQIQSWGKGTAARRFAPAMIHKIPEPYGGHAIRRLEDTGEGEATVREPQRSGPIYTASSRQRASYAEVQGTPS